jgi:hypothetical protein
MHLARALPALLLVILSGPAWSGNSIWWDAMFNDRWQGDLATDPMTDEKVLYMSVTSTNINRRTGFDLARVYLTCRSGKPRMVIEWGFKAAGSANLVAQYRFAGKPGRTLKVRYVNRTLQESTVAADIHQFIADAIGSDSLSVQVSSDLLGINTAEFKTKLGESMAAHFGESCPAVAVK